MRRDRVALARDFRESAVRLRRIEARLRLVTIGLMPGLSQELRTALNAAIGWAALLRTGGLDEARRACAIEAVERNARLHGQLVSDLVDLSRMADGRLRLEPQRVDLARVVDAAAAAPLRAIARAKPVSLTVSAPHALVMMGDADRLRTVAHHLMANAVSATPPGGRVTVRLRREGPQAVLTVRDTGIGITAARLASIFDGAPREAAPAGAAPARLGVGLPLVRHLVELHGGTVAAVSAGEGRGATFTVRLPLACL